MTPDDYRLLSGVIAGVGFLAMLHQIHWQVRIGLLDRQSRSAFLFLLTTAVIVGQLVVSYLSIVPLGTTERGPIFFFLWVAALIWWSWCTARHNGAILRRRRQRDALRKPLD